MGVAVVGCVSPYAYDCGGPHRPGVLSGRFDGDCGCSEPGGCASCGGCSGCAQSADVTFQSHTLTGRIRDMATCGAGCGEIYWGEWINDPPDACDPCTNHGDWVGPQCCPPSCWSRLWSGLIGQRQTMCGAAGCDTCTDGGDASFDDSSGEVWQSGPLDLEEVPVADSLEPLEASEWSPPPSPTRFSPAAQRSSHTIRR